MNQETRKKVLLLSYYNNPDEVSASLDAHREYEQLRKHFDTTLVTRTKRLRFAEKRDTRR
jgi:macrodomain Ter protein organizer (MatP/YcbG family)